MPIFGCVQFIVLTSIAMLFYPGGTKLDPTSTGYMFFLNFFSDLGRTASLSGDPNTISFILFVGALFLSGLSFVIFFAFLPQYFPSTLEMQKYGQFIQKTGILAGFGFISIAFVPADVLSIIHDFMVVFSFFFTFLATTGLLYVTYTSQKFHFSYSVAYLILLTLIAIYAIATPATFWMETQESLFLRVTTQKLVGYTMTVCYLFQSFGILEIRNKYQTL